MRILSKTFLFIVALLFFSQSMTAQKPAAKKNTAAAKFKPPKLSTFLSTYKDSVTVPFIMAEAIIAAKLRVYDDNKTEYAVSSYQFLYRKRTVTEDEQTGKVTPSTSIASEQFKTSPLPALWVTKIREDLKSGDELYFFDVIAKDAKGRVMYASNLKIMVQ